MKRIGPAFVLSLAVALVPLRAQATHAPRTASPPAAPAAPAPSAAPVPTAEDDDPPPKAELDLHPRQGTIQLGTGLGTVHVPAAFSYLSPDDAEKLLAKGWGNPPGSKTLGMLIPAGIDPTGDDSWGVVITYRDDGHVSDEDAEKIDFADLLKDMQASTKEESAERVKGGFDAMDLVGWAAPPHYDRKARKIYWALDLKFAESTEDTLNYNIRILGKDGVLVLNAVASVSQLPQVEAKMQDILGVVDFSDGHRYEQFNPKTDHMAAYGLAALVAGGVAAKTGLLKGLFVALLAAKKLIVAGLVAAGGFFAKIFKRRKEAV